MADIHAAHPRWKNLTSLETVDFRDNPRLREVPAEGWGSLGETLKSIDLRDSGLEVLPPQLCDKARMGAIERLADTDKNTPLHLSRIQIAGTKAARALDWSTQDPPLDRWPHISQTCLKQFANLTSMNLSNSRLGADENREDFFEELNVAWTPDRFPLLRSIDLRNISMQAWSLSGGWKDSVLTQAMTSNGLRMGSNPIRQFGVLPMKNETVINLWLDWFARTRSESELHLVTDCSLASASLTLVPKAVKKFVKLRSLIMFTNRIERIGPETFEGLEDLATISMGTNAVRTIAKNTFKDQKTMLMLGLGTLFCTTGWRRYRILLATTNTMVAGYERFSNVATHVTPPICRPHDPKPSSICALYVHAAFFFYTEFNDIRSVEDGAFDGADNLRMLSLHNNNINGESRNAILDYFQNKNWTVETSNPQDVMDYYEREAKKLGLTANLAILNSPISVADWFAENGDVFDEHHIYISLPACG